LQLGKKGVRLPLFERETSFGYWGGREVRQYDVQVRNETTGEVRVVEVHSNFDVDAQIAALHRLFHEEGWRQATALKPLPPLSAG